MAVEVKTMVCNLTALLEDVRYAQIPPRMDDPVGMLPTLYVHAWNGPNHSWLVFIGQTSDQSDVAGRDVN